MVMNGFDTDGDGANNVYGVNGPAFYYAKYPIRVSRSQTVRIYLANLTEFDLINSFHLHGEFFRYYPTGSSDQFEYTDTVMLCQGQRGIIEIDFQQHRPVHVPRAPVGVRRARLDGLLRGRRLMEAAVAEPHRARRLAALGARADPTARRRRRALRLDRRLVARPGRPGPPPADEFDVRRVEFQPGEITIRVTNPQRPRPHDRGGHGRRRDRPVPPRRAGNAHAAAFEHRRRPVPVGRRRPVHGRDHELDGNRDDDRHRRRDRDPRPLAAQLPRLCADRPARGCHPGGARARLAALAPSRRRAVARRIHGADGRLAHVPRVRRARRGARPPGHASRRLPGAGARSCSASPSATWR